MPYTSLENLTALSELSSEGEEVRSSVNAQQPVRHSAGLHSVDGIYEPIGAAKINSFINDW